MNHLVFSEQIIRTSVGRVAGFPLILGNFLETPGCPLRVAGYAIRTLIEDLGTADEAAWLSSGRPGPKRARTVTSPPVLAYN